MMKNLRKNILVSLVFVLVAILLLSTSVKANSSFLQGSGEEVFLLNPEENTTDENATTNEAENVATNIFATTNTANVQRVNNINDASKDIPQTGENDIYMVTAIGIIAIVIGGIAYAKSKRYDIK